MGKDSHAQKRWEGAPGNQWLGRGSEVSIARDQAFAPAGHTDSQPAMRQAGIYPGLTQTLLPERAIYIRNCSRTGTAQAIPGSKNQARLCSTPALCFHMVNKVAARSAFLAVELRCECSAGKPADRTGGEK